MARQLKRINFDRFICNINQCYFYEIQAYALKKKVTDRMFTHFSDNSLSYNDDTYIFPFRDDKVCNMYVRRNLDNHSISKNKLRIYLLFAI